MYIKSSYGTSKIYTVLFINCCYILIDLEVVAVQSLSCVWPFATPWTAAPGFPVVHCLREFAQTCPLSRWCNPTILSSVAPFSSCLQSFSETGSFLTSDSLHQVVKVLELQLQHQSFQWIFTVDFLQVWLVWSPRSQQDSQESSPAPQFKSINSSVLSLL